MPKPNGTPEGDLLRHARRRARAKGIRFTLTRDDIHIPARCPLLGIPLKRNLRVVGPDSPTLDRINPKRGYVPDNVWVISSRANTIKSDATACEIIRVGTSLRQWLGDREA